MPRLDQQRERIQDDLRGLVSGEVRCDDLFLQLHASDASIYEIRPQAVVRPRHAVDVAACVRYAREKKLPIHARGAGSGSAGESLGPGIVVDFSKYLRRIIRLDGEKARVQPGMVLERFNAQLRAAGRLFGPDPGHAEVTTVGGLLARDSAGSRWLKYGSAQDHVLSLQVVLADGEILDFGREPLVDGQSTSTIPRKKELIDRLAALLRDRAEIIRNHRLKSPLKRCGYNLDGVLGEDYLDVARLLVGSEGTLALMTEATLATQPLARPARRDFAAVREFGKSRAHGAGDSAVEADRLRIDGPPAFESRAGQRSPLRSADSRRSRSGASGRAGVRRSARAARSSCECWPPKSARKSDWHSAPGRRSSRKRPNCFGIWSIAFSPRSIG